MLRRFQYLGFNPSNGERYPKAIRWPTVLAAALEAEFPGNTKSSPRGRTVGPRLGRSRRPQERLCVFTALSRDPQTGGPRDHHVGNQRFEASLRPLTLRRGEGVAYLAGMVKTSEFGPGNSAPAVLIVAPPPFGELSAFDQEFEGGAEKSLTLGRDILAYAAQKGFPCFDAGALFDRATGTGYIWSQRNTASSARLWPRGWSISSGSLVRRHRLRSPHPC